MSLCCRVIAGRLDAALQAVPLGALPTLYLLGQNLFPIRTAQSIVCVHDLNLAPICTCYQMGFIERTPNAILTEDAIALLCTRLSTPLQFETYLKRAFEEGFNVAQKPVTVEVIESI